MASSRSYTAYNNSAVFRNRERRNKRCIEKDKILLPILSSLNLNNPKSFKAILMPCLWGPELIYLRNKNVPPENIFIIERERRTWATIRSHPSWGPHLHNVKTTYKPLPATQAIDFAYAEIGQCDLIYLDFFGQPNNSHWFLFRKIFKLEILKQHGKFLATFGKTRCRGYVHEINKKLSKEVVPTLTMIKAAMKINHQNGNVYNHQYSSREGNGRRDFLTTIVSF